MHFSYDFTFLFNNLANGSQEFFFSLYISFVLSLSVYKCMIVQRGKIFVDKCIESRQKNSMRKVVLDTQYKDEEEDDDDEEKNWKRG